MGAKFFDPTIPVTPVVALHFHLKQGVMSCNHLEARGLLFWRSPRPIHNMCYSKQAQLYHPLIPPKYRNGEMLSQAITENQV